ncbi:hypothetical protein NPIL_124471 [Nephila pilipes]|uniref:Uncharacterized protein n=1 Tax=Nephila pilipes TaxID=299642 RepID=A0A8X6PU42_NEPPI|nr:hypothetical protein NPIL_124471 [Nephila pilipes]
MLLSSPFGFLHSRRRWMGFYRSRGAMFRNKSHCSLGLVESFASLSINYMLVLVGMCCSGAVDVLEALFCRTNLLEFGAAGWILLG